VMRFPFSILDLLCKTGYVYELINRHSRGEGFKELSKVCFVPYGCSVNTYIHIKLCQTHSVCTLEMPMSIASFLFFQVSYHTNPLIIQTAQPFGLFSAMGTIVPLAALKSSLLINSITFSAVAFLSFRTRCENFSSTASFILSS
jgi:hypothetical protein